MFKKSLLTMLLMVLLAPWAANAQQALPYSYGFENNDLATEGWTAQIESSYSGISSSYAYEGTYSFKFSYSEQSGYLVSPLLTGTDAGIDLTFYYYESSNYYGDEEFYVGYTTDETVTDPADFTYGSIVTASTSWQEYTTFLPAGTKRIAISYVYDDRLSLYLDAFSFEAPGAVAKPTDLVVSDITAYGATLAWTENGTATSWEICVNDDETNLIPTTSNPYTFANLTPQTTYSVKVRAVAGGESSSWSSPVSFTTAEVCPDGLICIGQGTSTNSYLPLHNYYKYSLTEQIYTAEEIGESGTILSIAFYKAATTEMAKDLAIYMVNTTKDEFTSTTDWITVSAADLVFTGTVTFEDNAWTTIELDNPFDYDGTSNLAIVVDNNTGAYKSTTPCYAFTTAKNQAIYQYSDSNNYDPTATEPGTASNVTSSKNRIRLEIGEPPACPKPKNVTVSDIEPFAATVNWEGTAGNYNLRYREARGFNYGFEGVEHGTVDDFPPCTTYDGDGLATWGISGYSFPNTNYTGSVVVFNDPDNYPAHGGTAFGVFMDSQVTDDIPNNDDYFITPELTIAAGDHFVFWARSINDSYGLERIKVGVYGGNGTITSYLAGSATEYVQVPVAWTEYDYDLTAYVGQTIQLAINCVSADAFGLFIDDLFVGNPNDNTWDETIENIAANTYELTGLSDNTYYEVQVQSACGTDGESEWVDADKFLTPDGCGKPTNLAAADITVEEATLSWDGYWNTYNLKYRTAESRVTYYFNDFNDQNIEGWTYNGTWIYGFTDPIYDVAGDDNYFLAMGWSSTNEETIVSCELPAYDFGAYVEFYYFGNQIANTIQVGYSTTTNDVEAFTWSEPIDAPLSEYTLYRETLGTGVKYIAWKATASTSQTAAVFIDDFGIFGETTEAGDWETVTAVTSPYTLDGLIEETKYEWQVQGINATCEGGVTEWSKVAKFTTLSNCEAPTNLEATDITDNSATLTWEGFQDDYSVRYRAHDHLIDPTFTEDFAEGEIGDWTMVDCHSSSGAQTGYFMFWYTTTPPQYLISPELNIPDGSGLSFLVAAYNSYYSETFKVGYSSTGNDVADFTWGTEYSISSTSGAYFTDEIPDGTKYFAIQCTSDNKYALLVTDITVGTYVPTEDWNEEEARGEQFVEISGLEADVLYEWQVMADGCDDSDWSASSYFYTLETPATQVTNLTEGWNWFSIYVAIEDGEEEEAMLKLQESLGTNGLTIKSIEDFTTYASGDWGDSGDLDAVDNLNMYMIEVGADCTVELDGTATDPADYEITLNYGWNWVGFPSAEVISIEDAFADFEAADGDQIKTMEDFSTYADGWGDTGDLEELTPGQGFLYYSTSATPKTLILSTGSSKRTVSAKPVVTRRAMPFIKEVKSARIELPSKSLK